jgi:2,3,4,5-tetrahydropyridine-2-carboxylate N-succinyltransferase
LTLPELERAIVELAREPSPPREAALPAIERLLEGLESGEVRAAEPAGPGEWRVQPWVKQGILLAFRVGVDVAVNVPPVFHFRDRDTLPPSDLSRLPQRVRVVPGGTTVRRGVHLGEGVVVMPPAFLNVGAYVGEGTLVDSHVLVGSCAQIGARVHLSAGVQIGGVLEPIGALPVIVEDEAFVGGGCGIYEGTRVGARAVLAAGVVLTGSVPLYDLVRQDVYRATGGRPLLVPEGAVVVPGARPASGEFAARLGIELQAPVIVKYREPSASWAEALEEALR